MIDHEFEKEAGKGIALTGKLLKHLVWRPGKSISRFGGKKLYWLGKHVGKGTAATAAAAGKRVSSNFASAPVSMLALATGMYASREQLKDMLTGKRYQSLVRPHREINFGSMSHVQDADFGRRLDVFPKFGEDTGAIMTPMRAMIKEAGMMDNITEKLIGGALMGTAGALFAPTLATLGQKFQRKFFNAEDTSEALQQYAQAKGKARAQYEAGQDFSNKDMMASRKKALAAAQDIFHGLKSTDKVIGEAAKDPNTKKVMEHTMHTVSAFAPDIAADQRAMQSILRQSVVSPEGGLDFPTIKMLSETQKFINEARNKKWPG